MRTDATVLCFVMSNAACGLQPEIAAPPHEALPFTNSTDVETCGFANVGWVGNCTASLIHPQVVITAAHCGERSSDHERHPASS